MSWQSTQYLFCVSVRLDELGRTDCRLDERPRCVRPHWLSQTVGTIFMFLLVPNIVSKRITCFLWVSWRLKPIPDDLTDWLRCWTYFGQLILGQPLGGLRPPNLSAVLPQQVPPAHLRAFIAPYIILKTRWKGCITIKVKLTWHVMGPFFCNVFKQIQSIWP